MQNYNKACTPLSVYDQLCKYLTAHGFRQIDNCQVAIEGVDIPKTVYFFNGLRSIIIHHDVVDFALYSAAYPNHLKNGFQITGSHTGIASMSFFDWMLLLHISGMVTIRSFINNVIKEGVHFSTEEVLQDLLAHFRVTENHDAVPLNY